MSNQKVVVLNAAKMNYDGLLDFSVLSPETIVYDDSEPGQILERIQGARAVVTKELQVPAEMIAQFPDSVELICEAGTGYNNIAIDAAVQKGITVCNVPAYSSHRVAHTAVMMMLNLSSKTLGVVGYGNIGRQVIKVGQALDMKVLCYTRTPRPDQENLSFVSLETLLKESDYVSLHCPLNDKTRHIINEETLALMKPSAFLINTSRGALIDEPALISALQAGKIAGAGLDVQETEPPAADNPLYTLDNVIITPHMGWKGLETRQRLVGVVADDIRGFFEGKPVNVVS